MLTFKIHLMNNADRAESLESAADAQSNPELGVLGYDPKPDVTRCNGTPIPPVYKPLPATPELVAIAETMWWNGDPWTILRNRDAFLKHAMDWTSHEEFLYLWKHLPRADWVAMLNKVRPGEVSRRSYQLCMFLANLLPFGSPPAEAWRENRHVKDMLYTNFRERLLD